MKTAILLATRKGDSLAVKFLLHGPFSDVLGVFKARAANDRGEPGYDSLEIWTGPPAKIVSRLSSGAVESAGIRIVAGEGLTAEQVEELSKAWADTHAELTSRISELEERLASLQTKSHDTSSSELTAESELPLGTPPAADTPDDPAQPGTMSPLKKKSK